MKCLMVVGEMEGCFWMNVIMSNIQTSENCTAFEIEIAGSLRFVPEIPKIHIGRPAFCPKPCFFQCFRFSSFLSDHSFVLFPDRNGAQPSFVIVSFPNMASMSYPGASPSSPVQRCPPCWGTLQQGFHAGKSDTQPEGLGAYRDVS